MSEKRLRNIAIWYSDRYLVSSAKLTNHLDRRLLRDVKDSEERAGYTKLIPEIVAELVALGFVNDREAASARLRAVLRSGYASEAAVRMTSRETMVDPTIVAAELKGALTQTLPQLVNNDTTSDDRAKEQAVLALKRSRRGPFRSQPQDIKSHRRDAGWLQRRGFSLNAARYALGVDLIEE
ncbi:MAG: RecX family transcriptional regulator [Pseudomonadota bacterium]|nr:RecX family transcriptional regulator [Pseudomonadota bacterium]